MSDAQLIERFTLFLAGDSTLANKPYANGNPEKGWGQVLDLYFEPAVTVDNRAVNGRSTKSFRDEGRWARLLDDVREGDYVLIQFGHNDKKQEDATRYAAAETDYRHNLERFVAEVREKKATPILATPIVRRRFEAGELTDMHGDYPRVVREVAAEQKVPLIDLEQRTRELVIRYGEERSKALFLHLNTNEYDALPNGRADDTHLSAYGAFRVCDLAAEEMRRVLPAVAKFLKE